jgi:hypothetical protein
MSRAIRERGVTTNEPHTKRTATFRKFLNCCYAGVMENDDELLKVSILLAVLAISAKSRKHWLQSNCQLLSTKKAFYLRTT